MSNGATPRSSQDYAHWYTDAILKAELRFWSLAIQV